MKTNCIYNPPWAEPCFLLALLTEDSSTTALASTWQVVQWGQRWTTTHFTHIFTETYLPEYKFYRFKQWQAGSNPRNPQHVYQIPRSLLKTLPEAEGRQSSWAHSHVSSSIELTPPSTPFSNAFGKIRKISPRQSCILSLLQASTNSAANLIW